MHAPGPSLHHYARTQLARASACLKWRGRRVHTGVHQARKSMRRVRACLALAGFERHAAGKTLDRAIALLCRDLSSLRDSHARIETLDRLISAHVGAEAATLLRRVRRTAVDERSSALNAAERQDAGFAEHRRALDACLVALDALPWANLDGTRLQAALAHTLKRCRKAEARALAGGDAEDWHRWRRRRRRLLQQHSALEACDPQVAQSIDPQRELAHHLGESQDLSVLFEHFGHGSRLPKQDRDPLVSMLKHELEHKQRQIERWLDEHEHP